MSNMDIIRDKLIELNMTVEGLAMDLGINRSTLYRKLKSSCENLTVRELRILAVALQLTEYEIVEIFLTENSHETGKCKEVKTA